MQLDASSLYRNPFPSLDTDEDKILLEMKRSKPLIPRALKELYKHIDAPSYGNFADPDDVYPPFPCGTLIGERYRVIKHIKTGKKQS